MFAGPTGAPSTVVIVNEPSAATLSTETVWRSISEPRIWDVRDSGPAAASAPSAAGVSVRRGSSSSAGAAGAAGTSATAAATGAGSAAGAGSGAGAGGGSAGAPASTGAVGDHRRCRNRRPRRDLTLRDRRDGAAAVGVGDDGRYLRPRQRDDPGDVRREAPAAVGAGGVDEREERGALGGRGDQHAGDARARLAHVEHLECAVASRELLGDLLEPVVAAHLRRAAAERWRAPRDRGRASRSAPRRARAPHSSLAGASARRCRSGAPAITKSGMRSTMKNDPSNPHTSSRGANCSITS